MYKVSLLFTLYVVAYNEVDCIYLTSFNFHLFYNQSRMCDNLLLLQVIGTNEKVYMITNSSIEIV